MGRDCEERSGEMEEQSEECLGLLLMLDSPS